MDAFEILLILVVGIIVVGPKRLPAMMRTVGRWIAKARRTIFEVRANTGIDKLIRDEGLENEVREISNLTRSKVLSSLVTNNPVTMATRSISGALAATAPAEKASAAAARASAGAVSKTAIVKELAPEAAPAAAAALEPSAAEPALMTGPQPNAAALALIKPAQGAISRRDEDVLRLLMRTATGSTRDREYPTIGCDSYDVMPDDIDDPEAYEDPPEEEPDAPGDITEAAGDAAAPDQSSPPEIERAG